MPTVVIAHETFPDIAIEQEVLGAAGLTIIHIGNLHTPEALAAAQEADAIMVSIQPVTAEIIATLKHCRHICRVGTGLDAIDIPAATARGIWVTNVGDYSIDEVSTHAISLLLYYARRLQPMLESVRAGKWYDASKIEPAPRLKGQVLGLLGYGRIGQAVAHKARALGLEVIVYDPYIQSEEVRVVDLDTLLSEADFISLHAPLTAATRQIINAEVLSKMKPTAYLINTARGGLVDEAALVDAVRSGKIAGAALDVLTVEPPPADHPLLHEPRITITPHGAWYSEAAKYDVRYKAAEDVVRVLNGQTPNSPVNRPDLKT